MVSNRRNDDVSSMGKWGLEQEVCHLEDISSIGKWGFGAGYVSPIGHMSSKGKWGFCVGYLSPRGQE